MNGVMANGNVIETKVGVDKSSYFELFQDFWDHLGEVQSPRTASSRTGPRGVPGTVPKIWDLLVLRYLTRLSSVVRKTTGNPFLGSTC